MAIPVPAFQWDLARQIERFDWLLAQLPRYADWGYRELHLHLEDAVDYPSLPGVARPGAYSHRRLGRLVEAAHRRGIGVVPIVNLLGHTQYLIKVPALRDLNELRAADGSPLPQGQICPLHPRTPEIAEKLLRDVAPFCTAGKVHVGLDESYHLGRHPLSHREIAEAGMAGHFARYVGKLHGIAGGLGLRLGLWGDMLALLPGAIHLLPRGVVVHDWYYYPFRSRPRIELRNFAEYDLAPALRARGIEYWGCPMSGAFRHEPLPIVRERLANILSWWRRCRATGAAGMLVTSWEPQRLAAEIPQAVEAAAAGLWLDGETDPERLWKKGCRRAFGSAAGARAARALARADDHPFSGYQRWRINDRWDTVLGDGVDAAREARAFRRLAAADGLPPAVAASLQFRHYVAERDAFVRQAGSTVARLRAAAAPEDGSGGGPRLPVAVWHHGRRRREVAVHLEPLLDIAERSAAEFAKALARGRAAARAMWSRTRDPRARGPNEAVVDADETRLRTWRAWLRRCRAQPGRAFTRSPVAGAWQLVVVLRQFAPAAQKVAVEQRGADGAWTELHGFFLIEFRARAARHRTRLLYRLSAPVDWKGPPEAPPELRVVVRGFGRVAVEETGLTDGIRRIEALGGRGTILGRPAPARRFPDFDWLKNRGVRELRWGALWQKRASAVAKHRFAATA